MASRRPSSTEAVIGFFWDVAFAFFVVRLSFVYAALAVASTATAACLTHAAVLLFHAADQQQHVLHNVIGATNTTTTALVGLVSAALLVFVGLCSRLMMTYAKIPQIRGFRLAIGAMAAVYVGIGWLAAAVLLPNCRGGTDIVGGEDADIKPTPTNPHMFTPTAGSTMTIALFCQKSRINTNIGSGGSISSISSCTIVGIIFIAAVALMPWLSMVLLEQPSRRYYHQRTSSHCGWTTLTTPTTPLDEKKTLLSPASSSSSSSENEAAPRRAPKTKMRTAKKRYSLRNTSPKRTAK